MKKNKKTIMFFNAFYVPHLGGVETYTKKISEELKKDYHIIVVASNENNYDDIEILDDVKVYRFPIYDIFKNRYPFLKKNKKYKNMLKQLMDEKVDYIICNTRFYQMSLLGAKISKKKHCPLLFIDHSSDHVSIGQPLLDKFGAIYEHHLTNKIKKYHPKFYGVSQRCNQWLKHFHIEASGVFYNSIDDSLYKKYATNKKNNHVVISYIGRLIPEKGVVHLLDAYQQVKEKHQNIELYIAGDGPILPELKKKYKDDSIHFMGKLSPDEVMKLCDKTDIFVHPSMYPEGLPTVILEAGIMKTAVIATDRGGTKEVVNNEKVGIIVEENVSDLVKKMNQLIEHPKEIDLLKENIHKRIIENFTWKQTALTVKKELEKYE